MEQNLASDQSLHIKQKYLLKMNTVMILNFQAAMPGQTVQTQIRLLL